MNSFLVVAGTIGFLGGLAHTFLGDRWTVAPLNPDQIGSSQNTGDQNKRYLRWWWHIGSVFLLSTSALLLMHGLNQFQVHTHLLNYVSFLWISVTTIFFVLTLQPPVQAFKMIPGLVGIPVNVLIILGLMN